MLKIKIIVGSSRQSRFGTQPAEWIASLTTNTKDVAYELIDLKDLNLPMFDEAVSPMMNQYTNEQQISWGKVVGDSDGFIFVTPEYNHSITAVLKNAIDFLYAEWKFKPAGIVSYGANPGGARAVEHLKSILTALGVYPMGGEQLTINNYWTQLNDQGKFQPTAEQEKAAKSIIKDVTFWAGEMKTARANMAKNA